jgi:hypothetical protein
MMRRHSAVGNIHGCGKMYTEVWGSLGGADEDSCLLSYKSSHELSSYVFLNDSFSTELTVRREKRGWLWVVSGKDSYEFVASFKAPRKDFPGTLEKSHERLWWHKRKWKMQSGCHFVSVHCIGTVSGIFGNWRFIVVLGGTTWLQCWVADGRKGRGIGVR